MGGLHSKLSIDRSTKLTPLKNLNELESEDPRSPNIFRTPLSKASSSKTKRSNDMCPKNLLKTKLQDSVDNNLNDPRSPSSFIVRTPICLKNPLVKISDKSPKAEIVVVQNQLDDTYADADNDASATDNENENVCDISAVTEISTIDPRSPSLHIDRTPFFFTNKTINESNANDKEISSTLSKDATIAAADEDDDDDEKIQKLTKMIKTYIFEDNNENNFFTPPKKICEKKSMLIDLIENKQQPRTPLSCLANRKNGNFSVRNNYDESALKNFSGFAKGNNVFSSSRAEYSDENNSPIINCAVGGVDSNN